MKKINIFILLVFFCFCCVSCNKQTMSIEEGKAIFLKKLNEYSLNDFQRINTIGKYGDSYVFYSFGDEYESISPEFENRLLFGQHTFEISKRVTAYLYNNNELYFLSDAYNIGLLLYEDVIDIEEKFNAINGGEIDKDFDLIDNNPKLKRCFHEFKKWKIVKEASCFENGIEESKCSRCKNITRQVKTKRIEHSFVNDICENCNYIKSTLLSEDASLKQLLPQNFQSNFILGLNVNHKLYGNSKYYFYEIYNDSNPISYINIPIKDKKIFMPDNFQFVVLSKGKLYNYNEIKHLLSEEDYELIYRKYIERNISDQYISQNMRKIKINELVLFSEKMYEKLNFNLDNYYNELNHMNSEFVKKHGIFLTEYIDGKYLQTQYTNNFNEYNYFGKYNEVYVFYNMDFIKKIDNLNNTKEVVNGIEFNYKIGNYYYQKQSINNILVFNGSDIISLQNAFNNKMLNNEDINEIYLLFQ